MRYWNCHNEGCLHKSVHQTKNGVKRIFLKTLPKRRLNNWPTVLHMATHSAVSMYQGQFQKYNNTLCFPSKFLHLHCFLIVSCGSNNNPQETLKAILIQTFVEKTRSIKRPIEKARFQLYALGAYSRWVLVWVWTLIKILSFSASSKLIYQQNSK